MCVVLVVLAALACTSLPALAAARSGSQERYLKAANHGVKQTGRWWNRSRHWYSSVLGGFGR